MKVLVVTNMYPTPEHKYFGIFVKEFVDSIVPLGVNVDVFFTNPKESRLNYLKDLPRLRKALQREGYDIYHIQHTYSMVQFYLSSRGLKLRGKVLFTIHEGETYAPRDRAAQEGDLLKRLIYLKRLKLWALNQAHYVVSVERNLPRTLGYKRPFAVIPPGIDIRTFKPMDLRVCRERLGLPQDVPIVFFPASPKRDYNKGYSLFLESLSYLPQKVHVVVGGNIPHEEMPYYINAANVVVQTSRFEASPMIVKETMACNRPMVSSKVGDVPEIFGNTEGYFLTDLDPRSIAQAIQKALDFGPHTQGRKRILELGLSLEQVAQKYLQIYKNLTKGRRNG